MANETNKFSLAEASSNDNGKTSGSKVLALYLGFIAGLCIAAGVVLCFMTKQLELFNSSVLLAGTCLAALSASKYISAKSGTAIAKPEEAANENA